MSNVGYATVSIIPSAKGFRANLESEIGPHIAAVGSRAGERGGRESGRKFGSAFVPAMRGFVGPALGLAAGFAVGQGIKTGLKTAAFMEQAKISFKTLLGSGGEAEKMLSNLSAFAAKTPFELPGVVASARALLGTGTAAKKVIPTLTSLGDATAALGLNQEAYASIVRAVTQVQSKGKFQAEEALQIAEAGLPIYPLLAKALHKPVPEIQKMMQAGKLLAKDALPALYAQMNKDYGGAMAEQSATLAGVWSTVKDTITQALGKALLPLTPLLTKVLPPAAGMVATAIQKIATGAQALIGPITTAKSTLSGLFDGVGAGGKGGGLLKSLSDTGVRIREFAAAVAPAFAQVGAALRSTVGPAIQSISDALEKHFLPGVRAILPVLAPVASWIIKFLGGVLVSSIKGAVAIISGVLKVIGGLFKVIASAVKGDWGGMWQGVKSIASGALSILRGMIVALLGRMIGDIDGKIDRGLAIIAALPGKAYAAVKAKASALYSAGADLIRGFLRGIQSIDLMGPINALIDKIPAAVRKLLGIHSPSRVFMEIGGHVGEGLVLGITSKTGAVTKAAEGLVRTPDAGRFNGASAAPGAVGGGVHFHGPVGYDPEEIARRIVTAQADAQAVEQIGAVL